MRNIKKIFSLIIAVYIGATNVNFKVKAGDPQIVFEKTKKNNKGLLTMESISRPRGIILSGSPIMSSEEKINVLFYAVKNNYVQIVEHLISSGFDVNSKNYKGLSPLDYAVKKGAKEVAEVLIANGADVNAKNNKGFSPLHTASQ